MLNGDVLTDIDLTAQIAQHERDRGHGHARAGPRGGPHRLRSRAPPRGHAVEEFVEKPSPDQIDTNLISAGAYVLERSILDLMPPSATSRSSVRSGRGWSARAVRLRADGYWLDIGTPERYLQGDLRHHRGQRPDRGGRAAGKRLPAVDDWCPRPRPRDPARSLERGCASARALTWAAWWCWGTTCRSARARTIERAVILGGAEIGEGCTLRDCIVAAGCGSGRRRDQGGAVLGEGVTIGAENVVARGARIFPGVTLPDGAIRF